MSILEELPNSKWSQNTEKCFMGSAVNLQDIRLSLKRNVNKSKRHALLNPPVTSYINHWVNDKIRKIWKPRIISIAKAWER